jgi:hypothetical protein
MGNSGSTASGMVPYGAAAMPVAPVYVPMVHPGVSLLPPFELTKYDSLPSSISG